MYPSASIGVVAAALATACSIPDQTFAGMDHVPRVFLQRARAAPRPGLLVPWADRAIQDVNGVGDPIPKFGIS